MFTIIQQMTNILKNLQIETNILMFSTLKGRWQKTQLQTESDLTSDRSLHCISRMGWRDGSNVQTTQLVFKCCACQTWQKPIQSHTNISAMWENMAKHINFTANTVLHNCNIWHIKQEQVAFWHAASRVAVFVRNAFNAFMLMAGLLEGHFGL